MCLRSSRETLPLWARAITRGAPVAAPDWAITSAGGRLRTGPAGPPQRCAPDAGPSSPAGSSPAGNPSGTPIAPSFDADAATASAASSLSRAQRRSALRRELVKTMVERCCPMRVKTRSSTAGQIDARRGPGPPRSSTGGCSCSSRRVMSSTGTCTLTSMVFGVAGWTTSTGRAPPRNCAQASIGRTVAERPMRCAGVGSSSSRRSRERARWAPRLLPATACTSSTITVWTPRSESRAADVSSRNSDSGVVMRMSGGVRAKARRSSAGVSPVRMPTVMSGGATPSRVAACRMPASGARRLRSTSTARALSGLT
ncbi:hypothetical protein ONO23_06611 [Micromonospora noduli]|nr:hypothetical protein ONO23_06611 [Micromonospora noduli]